MGVHEQIGGVVALFEVVLVPDETCYEDILEYVDPCMDLDYPCDDNECTPKGMFVECEETTCLSRLVVPGSKGFRVLFCL